MELAATHPRPTPTVDRTSVTARPLPSFALT